MSPAIVKTVQAYVGETVRIVWTKRTQQPGNPDPASTQHETLEEDHTAPPPATWEARSKQSETQADFYPPSRYGSKYERS